MTTENDEENMRGRHRSAQHTVTRRNSSVELLRLVSMLMVVGYHYVYVGGGGWLAQQPMSVAKFVYQFVYMGGGWVANFMFFAMSVWFLMDREHTLTSGLRRVWILERQLLFWSITLLAVTLVLHHGGVYVGDGLPMTAVRSVFPLSTNLWWYASAYALFLVLLPFLNDGLRRLSKRRHGQLAAVCLVVWGVGGLVPHVEFGLIDANVFVFIYWYVLISYYRWHMRELDVRSCWALIGAGIVIELVYLLAANAIFMATGRMAGMQMFIFDHWRLPSMMIGAGIMLLALRRRFHSVFVNVLAASAFGVYLIHFYPPIFRCWTTYLPLQKVYGSAHPIIAGTLAILRVFVVCLLLDLLRQGLFHLTVDRHRGAWFDRLAAAVRRRSMRRHASVTSVGADSAR